MLGLEAPQTRHQACAPVPPAAGHLRDLDSIQPLGSSGQVPVLALAVACSAGGAQAEEGSAGPGTARRSIQAAWAGHVITADCLATHVCMLSLCSPMLPYRPQPQQYTSPSEVTATECSAPHATRSTALPCSGWQRKRRWECEDSRPATSAQRCLPSAAAAAASMHPVPSPLPTLSQHSLPPLHYTAHLQCGYGLRRQAVLYAAQPQLAVLVAPKRKQLAGGGSHKGVGVATGD